MPRIKGRTAQPMRPLAGLERWLERIFERPGARLFDARVEPVSLARRIERTIDEERRPGPDGPVAPTRFLLRLNARDHERLLREGSLIEDLAAAALDHARRRGYRIPERPTATLVADAGTAAGTVHVEAGFADAAFARIAPVAPRIDQTMVHAAANPGLPTAFLHVLGHDGSERFVPVGVRPIAIGRAPDNDVPLDDPLASRHHARILPRTGRLVLSDLDSTNGTTVNGRAVREAVLGIGDVIEIGGSRIAILATSGAAPQEAPWMG